MTNELTKEYVEVLYQKLIDELGKDALLEEMMRALSTNAVAGLLAYVAHSNGIEY